MVSKKYSLNKEDITKIVMALAYSGASAIVATLIVVVGEMDFGSYAFLIPMINALLYGAKKWLEGR
jgi:2-keto-3-deoxy-L-rhamnonate aldolase RhmA